MIDIEIQDETGETVESFPMPEVLDDLLPLDPDTTTYCLRFIDHYGDTVFNRVQLPILLAEIRARLPHVRKHLQAHAAAFVAFLERADEPHLYVKFIGD